ncbi:hypothetical protein Pth03_07960 [Planotetraspora thailandica]|uniref:Carboxypeptidase regulatory-like domain-containing protein n=1 Tax=Planotetraspora thailandica TaxID=487172 RepID=A0A8J3UYY0_9ACTN|nr:hypothetical protein [Planotetraspora thailandica]GII52407.1 hypothetical protein Pth03_07960 [Planotetraspora thailandica]
MPKQLKHVISWRAPFALFLGVALAAMLTVVAHPASAEALTIRFARATTAGWSTQIEVSAASDSDITKITARLRLYGSKEPFATVEDFELVSGTATDGVWRTSQPVTLEMGVTYIDVEATDASGATVTSKPAGRLDKHGVTRFSGFTISPSTVDVDHDTVTYTGRLVYEDRDGSERGVPGVTICLGLDGACVGNTTTDSDGRFSSPARLYIGPESTNMLESDAYASYSGDSLYMRAKSALSHLKVRPQQTRVSIGFSSLPKVIGDTVKVTGRLERKTADGQWTGVPDQNVKISAYDSDTRKDTLVTTARTGPDGNYSIAVVVPQATQWFVYFSPLPYLTRDGKSVLGPYASSNGSFDEVIPSFYRTSLSRFTVSPNPVGKGTQITASALLTKRTATGAMVPVTTGWLDLEFSKDRKSWSWQAGHPVTNGQVNGQVKVYATAMSSGYWRLHYINYDRDFNTVSASAHATVKYRTAISSLNAAPEPVRKGKTITVSGVLKRHTSSWLPLSGQSVRVYFRPYGSKTWSYMGAARSDRNGKWHKGFKASRDGTWMAKYNGSSTYLTTSSAGDYVDVR